MPTPPTFDVLVLPAQALEGSEEFSLGLRQLQQALASHPAPRWQFCHTAASVPSPAEYLSADGAPWVLVICNPAVLVSNKLLAELQAALSMGDVLCALPADPRAFATEAGLDYASRPGFERFVARLASTPRWRAYDGREPWLYLVSRAAAQHPACLAAHPGHASLAWQQLPGQLAERTMVCGHAFAHSYASYHENDRAEMLRLVPGTARALLDVGGGCGNFARAFLAHGGAQARVVDASARAAAQAQAAGLAVSVGRFGEVEVPPPAGQTGYDLVAMLDVLEHMADPQPALLAARQNLAADGHLLLSVPNVGHWSVVWDLLHGRFDYLPVGILCNTHLRFYTRSSLTQLLSDCGFTVVRWENAASPPPAAFRQFLAAAGQGPLPGMQGVAPDLESLSTESFHVLARVSAT